MLTSLSALVGLRLRGACFGCLGVRPLSPLCARFMSASPSCLRAALACYELCVRVTGGANQVSVGLGGRGGLKDMHRLRAVREAGAVAG